MVRKIIYAALLACATSACTSNSESGATDSTGGGQGGSLARFAVVGSYLYTVDESSLQVFDVEAPAQPVLKSAIRLGVGIETIFPKGSKLFVGSQTGMYIYDVSSPQQPSQLAVVEHVYSCDPVVVNDSYAFVTLNSASTTCWRAANLLMVIDIKDAKRPQILKEYSMESPRGLGVDDSTLFVCDKGRLKVYSVADPSNIDVAHPKHTCAFPAEEVIPVSGKGLLIAVGSNGLKQYRYSPAVDTITLLSSIEVER
ncbi:MAG: hypothetical protein LBS63_05495 [Prevotellaceae bacterium]|jgi:hypothetical protein|nr:hypothetical protein [Prevotellaceae bacterium]